MDQGKQVEMTNLEGLRPDPRLSQRLVGADYVAEALRDAIQSGRLADGAVLSQAAIAEHLEVSRMPVREAMRQLLAEGLIQWPAHHGAVVKTLPPERIGELIQYRAVIEGYITEQAVPRMTPAALAAVREKNEEMSRAADHADLMKLNAEFHRLILEMAGDETGLELYEWVRTRTYRYVRMWSDDGTIYWPDEAADEHGEIIRLIEAGDAAGARAANEAHIRRLGERLVAYGRARAGAAEELAR